MEMSRKSTVIYLIKNSIQAPIKQLTQSKINYTVICFITNSNQNPINQRTLHLAH